MIALGVDIGGTSVKMAAVENGKTLWTGQSPFYARPKTEELIAAMKRAGVQFKRTGESLRAGICVPGLLDKKTGMITLSVNVPGLMNVVLDDLVERGLGVRPGTLAILNDAVASCYDVCDTRGL